MVEGDLKRNGYRSPYLGTDYIVATGPTGTCYTTRSGVGTRWKGKQDWNQKWK